MTITSIAPIRWAAWLVVLATLTAAPAPDAEITKVLNLVQEDKTSEALRRVEALLVLHEDDVRLAKLKAQLAGGAAGAPTAAAPKAGAMSAEQRLEMNTQIALLREAWAKEAGKPRNRALAQALLRPALGGDPTPEQLLYWQARALSALELDVYQLGWEAGAKLRALGALETSDTKLSETMTALNAKGWLTTTLDELNAAEADPKKWVGTWTRSETKQFGERYGKPVANGRGTSAVTWTITSERGQLVAVRTEETDESYSTASEKQENHEHVVESSRWPGSGRRRDSSTTIFRQSNYKRTSVGEFEETIERHGLSALHGGHALHLKFEISTRMRSTWQTEHGSIKSPPEVGEWKPLEARQYETVLFKSGSRLMHSSADQSPKVDGILRVIAADDGSRCYIRQ